MLKTARILLALTIFYNVIEGVLALWSGVQAGSIALVGFGIDSYIEVAAASVVLWRLNIADTEAGERMEQRAMRFIGWTFLLLAAVIAFQAVWALVHRDGASESILGIALAATSVVVMPAVALWKLRIAAQGKIPILAAEAKETLACSYLSLTLLLGLTANALIGWWWIDPLTALMLTPWLVREGLEGVSGEHCIEDVRVCSCRACLYGLKTCPLPCCSSA